MKSEQLPHCRFDAQGQHVSLSPRICISGRIVQAAVVSCALLLAWIGFSQKSTAQGARPRGEPVFVPLVIDPDRRIERRDLPRGASIRFVTEEDYPPFNYLGRDGVLVGFHVDLARSICAELSVPCTIQTRRWDLLLPALEAGEADAVIAAHRITPDLRERYEMSLPTHRVPARFIARSGTLPAAGDFRQLAGRSVAVIGGSAHEAYLNAFFPGIRISRHEKLEATLKALQRAEADLVFADGIALAFWLNGAASQGCCVFYGGPVLESRFFGEGAGLVVRQGNTTLRAAIDYALWRLNRDGRYAKLFLKHFPMPFY
jgi:polar amino acid transport system substrate-binding protein